MIGFLKDKMGDLDTTQVALMAEECLLLDNDDKVIGYGSKQECHLVENIEKKGLLHRAFSIFLFDSKGRLLLQQRASEKITFPDYWTNTVCSHPLRGEEESEKDAIGVKKAAQRKIEHELGVRASELPLDAYNYITRLHYKAASDPVWGEHESNRVLLFLTTWFSFFPFRLLFLVVSLQLITFWLLRLT